MPIIECESNVRYVRGCGLCSANKDRFDFWPKFVRAHEIYFHLFASAQPGATFEGPIIIFLRFLNQLNNCDDNCKIWNVVCI